MDAHGVDIDPEARVAIFNQLGEQGWELISPPNHSGWYFKRIIFAGMVDSVPMTWDNENHCFVFVQNAKSPRRSDPTVGLVYADAI